MAKLYPNLSKFFSYFYPGWTKDFGDISGAMEFFFETSDTATQKGISREINDFLNQHSDDRRLLMALISMGCSYNPAHQDMTLRQWLGSVQKQIDEKLNTTKPTKPVPMQPSNGPAGKTSDDRLRRRDERQGTEILWQWVLALVCIVALILGIYWGREQFYEPKPNLWPSIAIVAGAFLVLPFLSKVSTWFRKTVAITTFLAIFVMACYRGLFQAANQAAGGVMHQLGSDPPSSSAPQPSYSPSRVTAQQGARPKGSLESTVTVEKSCAERGFEGNWQWKTIDIKPGDPEHVLTSKGILMPGNRVQICADAETPQDLHKLLIWVGAEPNASSASTWRPNSKSQKVWYVDKRIQFGFKADAEPGGYLHFLAEGELKSGIRVYVWIGA